MSFGALHVARTGLDAQGFRMQVIANNLANVNTTGFKRDRANFETLGYQMMTQPGAPSSSENRYATGLNLGTGVELGGTARIDTQDVYKRQAIGTRKRQPSDSQRTASVWLSIAVIDACSGQRASLMRRSIGVAVRPIAFATIAVSVSMVCQSSVACCAVAAGAIAMPAARAAIVLRYMTQSPLLVLCRRSRCRICLLYTSRCV